MQGATFPSSTYESWSLVYPVTQVKRTSDLAVTYNAVGSGSGRNFLRGILTGSTPTNFTTDLGASDSKINTVEMAAGLRTIPMLVGSMCLVYYIPGKPAGEKLILTREAIVGIFNGTIKTWNHALLVERNTYLASIPENITVVVRSDSSGSTEILTNSLSAFSSTWKTRFSSFSVFAGGWSRTNVSYAPASGDVGIALKVMQTPNSLGYMDLTTANTYGAPFAYVVNRAGSVVAPLVENMKAALSDFKVEDLIKGAPLTNFSAIITDGNGTNSYPLVAFTYYLIRLLHPTDCTRQYEAVRYTYWGLTDPKASEFAAESFFLTVNSEISDLGQQILGNMTCGGVNMLAKVKADIAEELRDVRGQTFAYSLIGTCLCVRYIRDGSQDNGALLTSTNASILKPPQRHWVGHLCCHGGSGNLRDAPACE
jgi:phosphate transport system substrate-binding protein